ncbi:ribosome maturation factor RimP [Wenzhouxiangella sp. EGI_FJ10409]|uniref:ribosome maturation factor RimP n=1 Tax=Wenzhouxiangella sp. EGI_FJ10409 TaxID=3243767 RepID=UPI0035E093BA
MAVSDKLQALLAPLVEDLDYEFVGIEYQSNPKNRLIRLYIDRPEVGIGIEDCERVSREVSALLDVEDPVSGQYTLEVSSPGIERPLFTGAHFARFVGEMAKVMLAVPMDGRRKFKGLIVGADDEQVVLDVDGEHFTLTVADIQRAHLAPDVDALLAEKRH